LNHLSSKRKTTNLFNVIPQRNPQRAINETGSFQTWGTTWNGEILGRIHTGKEWRDNFGGKRVSFIMSGINGKSYHGTYYKSAGDYCRIKMTKNS